MAIMKYGQTWWGGEWLKALSQLDYDNRLPRGRTYANKGAVKDLKVSGGQIAAKVKGSRPSLIKSKSMCRNGLLRIKLGCWIK